MRNILLLSWVDYDDNYYRESIPLRINRLLAFYSLSIFSLASVADNLTVTVHDHLDKPLSNVVVYLEPPASLSLAPRQEPVEVIQADKAFAPYIAVMQKGASVKFKNDDDITHHIYSPVGDNKFAFKISAGQERMKHDFQHAGDVVMGCNIHDWMSGHLLILETPYFAKTNEQGNAVFDVKDKGQYQVVVWHPQMLEKDNRIAQSVNFERSKKLSIKLTKPLAELPNQVNEDDFDFLSDY